MKAVKRLLFILFLVFAAVVISGCGKDKVPPELEITADEIKHTEGADIDLIEFIKQYIEYSDNVTAKDDIEIDIDDFGNYDRNKKGTYVITVCAKDRAGNITRKQMTIIVIDSDTLAPAFKMGSVTTLYHIAGETPDLTQGLEGVDDVDGIDVAFKVVQYGDYDAGIPGTYEIKVVVYDRAGNESAPVTRIVVVSDSYARAEMVSFAGEIIRYEALYNPQVLAGHTGAAYNTAYDGHYVNVLSKEYIQWLLNYAPERIGSGVGWSVIAVTDAADKIVYVRHWNSGEAYLDGEGNIVSVSAVNWSSGTNRNWNEEIDGKLVYRTNARYSSGEAGLMMANINDWVPVGGHIFMFMNWTTIGRDNNGDVVVEANTSSMARAMGANYIMNSDEDEDGVYDYALGRELKIIDAELSRQSVRKTFNPAQPFPIISVPGKLRVATGGEWKTAYTDTVYLSDKASYDPLFGVSASDGKGNDITGDITYKAYTYRTGAQQYGAGFSTSLPITDPRWGEYFENIWKLEEHEVMLADVLVPGNNNVYFVIEYAVSANGHTDKLYRLIQIKAEKPDYIELYDGSDTVYSLVMGLEQRLDMNPDLDEFGPMGSAEKGILFDYEGFQSMGDPPAVHKGILVVLDELYRVKVIRVLAGAAFEIDSDGNTNSEGLTWPTAGIFSGLTDVLTPGGYALFYPEGKEGLILNKALRAFADYDYEGEDLTGPVNKNKAVEVKLVLKEVQEVSSLLVNDEAPLIVVGEEDIMIKVIENSKESLIFTSTGGGAGFRLDTGKAYYYSKDVYAALAAAPEVVDSFTNLSKNRGVPWFNNGCLIVVDADGKFVSARVLAGAGATVKADGTVLFGENAGFDLNAPDDTIAHGPLVDILGLIPDGGGFFIFPYTNGSPAVRNYAITLIWNALYPGSGAIVDTGAEEPPANAATNGFDAEVVTAEYLGNLRFAIDLMATIIEKPEKISRPNITLDENILSWKNVSNAASYDLYVDGMPVKKNIGIADGEDGIYTFSLSAVSLASGWHDIQLRALSADTKEYSASVLSAPVRYEVLRMPSPDLSGFLLEDNVLSWPEVNNANGYFVAVGDGDYEDVGKCEFIIPDEYLVSGTIIWVIAKSDGVSLDSPAAKYTLDIPVRELEAVLGPYTLSAVEFVLSAWLRHVGNDMEGSTIGGLIYITDADKISGLDDETVIFAGGYAALLDAEFNVKYVVDRWGREWTEAEGWSLNGADEAAQWAYGKQLPASYFKPHVAEGDVLIMASQWSEGLEEGSYRNYFGNALICDIGTVAPAAGADHRIVNIAEDEMIDPSAVIVAVNKVVRSKTITLGSNQLPVSEYELEKWLGYIETSGDIEAAAVLGVVALTGIFGVGNLDDDFIIFSGGYAALLDENLKVKYVFDRWGREWTEAGGWILNGVDEDAQMAYGLNLKASYLKDRVAAGDILIMASQHGKGLPTGAYRDYFGNALIKNLYEITSHRYITMDGMINPKNVEISMRIQEKIIKLGGSVLNIKEFELDSWMFYASPSGGNNVGANGVAGLILVNDAVGVKNLDDGAVVFHGGYVAVLNSDFEVKYIVDRWGREWTAANGWSTNPGGWDWALALKASYFKAHLENGDMLLMASQYGSGLGAGTYRDVFGDELIYHRDAPSGDHRTVVDKNELIDPTSVTIILTELK